MSTATPAPRSAALIDTAALGFAVGLRSALPFALLALAARRQPSAGLSAGGDAAWALLRSRGALAAVAIAAAGELVADKLPFAAARIAPPVLSERIVAGAVAGAAHGRLSRQPPAVAALIGALAAAGGATAGYFARRALGRATGVPDPVWAVAEDVLTASLGILALRRQLLA